MRKTVAFGYCVLVQTILPVAAEEGFVPLFDGCSLNCWVQQGGKAEYAIEGESIVGTSAADTPNSFLCTVCEYGDFILEVELKVDDGLNSGIQIRSHVYDQETQTEAKNSAGEVHTQTIPAGRVFGYQVEIDPTDRALSGGIYDEARRGWLVQIVGDQYKEARKAFQRGEWNRYRIEAIGNSIKTWINGVPIATLTDDVDSKGLIALQVHSVPADLVGKQVRWRRICIKEISPTER